MTDQGRDFSHFSTPPRPHAYATTTDDGVSLVIWRDGSDERITVPLPDPLALAQDLIARYREGQPRPAKLGD